MRAGASPLLADLGKCALRTLLLLLSIPPMPSDPEPRKRRRPSQHADHLLPATEGSPLFFALRACDPRVLGGAPALARLGIAGHGRDREQQQKCAFSQIR